MTVHNTPEPTRAGWEGLTSGVSTEFTLIVPLKPGGAQRLRELAADLSLDPAEVLSTIHVARFVIFDNDTRLLFATHFDGTWDQYIEDFGVVFSEASRTNLIDTLFQDAEGFPGIQSPDIKDYLRKHLVGAVIYYSAYPEATVKQLQKGQRVLKAWEEMLDASG